MHITFPECCHKKTEEGEKDIRQKTYENVDTYSFEVLCNDYKDVIIENFVKFCTFVQKI